MRRMQMKARNRGFVYINGQLLPVSKARISPLDYGYLYGYAVFETMRAYDGSIFRLENHVDRLMSWAEKIGIKSPDAQDLANAVRNTLRKNNHRNAYARLTLSAGEGTVGLNPSSCTKPITSVHTKEFKGYPSKKYLTGFAAVTTSITTNPTSMTSNLKSNSFLDRLIARTEATKADVDEAIMMTPDSRIAEGSVSNIFIVLENELRTPNLDSGILSGVTRNVVLELAEKLGVTIRECGFTLKELCSADEAFMTNSLIEVMPLSKVNDIRISLGSTGKTTRMFMDAYSSLVRFETSKHS